MEEITSNVTIAAVMMDHLVCHEVQYSGSENPIFGTFDVFWTSADAHWILKTKYMQNIVCYVKTNNTIVIN